MKTGIMQPYFMPYIGYFQMIAAVDLFIVYDNIKYTKSGWINRNRVLRNGKDVMISLPLKSDSDSLDVVERCLAEDFKPRKLLAQMEGAYRAAPFFRETFPFIEEILLFDDPNLFRFDLNSIEKTCAHLSIATPIRISSTFDIDQGLKAQDKVLALCQAAGADIYVNPIGGLSLYSKPEFLERGVELRFLRSDPFEYAQFGAPFVPWLSIIDVMMFNPPETIETRLRSGWKYE
jgi:hypothetical protein